MIKDMQHKLQAKERRLDEESERSNQYRRSQSMRAGRFGGGGGGAPERPAGEAA